MQTATSLGPQSPGKAGGIDASYLKDAMGEVVKLHENVTGIVGDFKDLCYRKDLSTRIENGEGKYDDNYKVASCSTLINSECNLKPMMSTSAFSRK